jgi:uncharacterized protein Usg
VLPNFAVDRSKLRAQTFVGSEPGRPTVERDLMSSFQNRLLGYRLTTAEILYHLPDHPHMLQSFIWQEFDLAPRFPALNKFLHFWQTSLDGKLHSVRVASRGLISDAELKMYDGEFGVN